MQYNSMLKWNKTEINCKSQAANNDNGNCPVKASKEGAWDTLYATENNKLRHSSERQAKQSHLVFVELELWLIVLADSF